MQKGHTYLHIGLVHVAVKPVNKNRIRYFYPILFERQRHKNFVNSMLGLVESSHSKRQIYFKCFPNFFVALFDPGVLKTFILNADTQGNDMELES